MIDAQRVLANDSWSGPGSWIDADMLTIGCNDNRIPHTPCDYGTPLTVTEEYTQMSLWCIFASNLVRPPFPSMFVYLLRALFSTLLCRHHSDHELLQSESKLTAFSHTDLTESSLFWTAFWADLSADARLRPP